MLEAADNGDIIQEVSEFIRIQTTDSAGRTFSVGGAFSTSESCNQEETFLNNRQRTLTLIELYKKYKPEVGSYDIRSMKKLWEVVAIDVSNHYKITISASKCENRWKTLEWNYKRVVDNNSKTGRDRKFFEYEAEFDIIYGKKVYITPTILLSSNSEVNRNKASSSSITIKPRNPRQSPVFLNIPEDDSENREEKVQDNQENSRAVQNTPQLKRKCAVKKMTNTYRRRNEILLEMKNDLQQYHRPTYREKSNREEQKLVLQRIKQEDRLKRTQLLEALLKNNQEKE